MKKTYKIFFVLLIIAIFFYFNPIIKTYANSEEDNIEQTSLFEDLSNSRKKRYC